MHAETKSKLGAWRELFATFSVVPAQCRRRSLQELFGADPQVTLIRPDGYAAFIFNEHSLKKLHDYMEQWVPHAASRCGGGLACVSSVKHGHSYLPATASC